MPLPGDIVKWGARNVGYEDRGGPARVDITFHQRDDGLEAHEHRQLFSIQTGIEPFTERLKVLAEGLEHAYFAIEYDHDNDDETWCVAGFRPATPEEAAWYEEQRDVVGRRERETLAELARKYPDVARQAASVDG